MLRYLSYIFYFVDSLAEAVKVIQSENKHSDNVLTLNESTSRYFTNFNFFFWGGGGGKKWTNLQLAKNITNTKMFLYLLDLTHSRDHGLNI